MFSSTKIKSLRDPCRKQKGLPYKRPSCRITKDFITERLTDHQKQKKIIVNRQEGVNGVIYTAGYACVVHCPKTNAVIVKIPCPVSTNVIWRNVRRNKMVLSKEAREYKEKVKDMYCQLLKQIGFVAFDCPIEARIEVQPRVSKKNYSEKTFPRFDADNYFKGIFDALKGTDLLYIDDKQIVCPTLRFAEPVEYGCVWVSIRPSQRTWLDKPVDFDWLLGLKSEAA